MSFRIGCTSKQLFAERILWLDRTRQNCAVDGESDWGLELVFCCKLSMLMNVMNYVSCAIYISWTTKKLP